jgi:hypothetical protein
MSDISNAAESDVVSNVASGHLTDVKQVPPKNSPWRFEVSAIQSSYNQETERIR